jgi:flagellar protein FliS
MLYDGIIRHLNSAMDAFSSPAPEHMETVHRGIQDARQIVLELKLALDKERGGEVAQSLDRLYDFWIEALYDANAAKDPGPVSHVLEMVQDMRDTWQEADVEARRKGVY